MYHIKNNVKWGKISNASYRYTLGAYNDVICAFIFTIQMKNKTLQVITINRSMGKYTIAKWCKVMISHNSHHL